MKQGPSGSKFQKSYFSGIIVIKSMASVVYVKISLLQNF